MKTNTIKSALGAAGVYFACASASAGTLTVIGNLGTAASGPGANAFGGLVMDAAGNLYGTALNGGANGVGTVFELVNNGSSYAAPTALASFSGASTGTAGKSPRAGLTFDASGNLFGTTTSGGATGFGAVFGMAKSGNGFSAPSLIGSFSRAVGDNVVSPVTFDAAGNILVGTSNDGANGFGGTVTEFAKSGSSYAAPSVVFNFNSSTGSRVTGPLVVDSAGSLIGTLQSDGAHGGGVFSIAKNGSGYSTSTPTILSNAGGSPTGGLAQDYAGNLFGTTQTGGANGFGSVFELPKTLTGYGSLITLASFNNGALGGNPQATLLLDANGDIFGTTTTGGSGGGTLFEIMKTAPDTYGALSTLATFTPATTGGDPLGALIADINGNLFGTTQTGGSLGGGTVYEFAGAGFATVADAALVPEPAPLVVFGAAVMVLGATRRGTTARSNNGRRDSSILSGERAAAPPQAGIGVRPLYPLDRSPSRPRPGIALPALARMARAVFDRSRSGREAVTPSLAQRW